VIKIHSTIQDAIKKCNLVFFVGSGFSIPVGLPSWKELVDVIINDLQRDYPGDILLNKLDIARVSEIDILDRLRPKHFARIVDTLEKSINIDLSSKDLALHKKLWKITDQVVTTNYDKILESIKPEICKKVVHDNDFHIAKLSSTESFLFKVHGCITQPDKCILFSDQYKKLYNKHTHPCVQQGIDETGEDFCGRDLS
jgi:hypothetical protein